MMAVITMLLIHISALQGALPPTGSFYELTWHALPTRDQFPPFPQFTSVNATVFGAKLGDRTRSVEQYFGRLDNTRTLEDEYLTIYREHSLFVYTNKANGELKRFELFQNFAKFIADAMLKKLLIDGDPEVMRRLLGPEDRIVIKTDADYQSTEYVYDRRGIVFVKYSVGGKTINALRLQKIGN